MTIDFELPGFRVNVNLLAPYDAGLTQPPGHHRCMAGDASPAGKHTGSGQNAVDIFGAGLGANQDHAGPTFSGSDGTVGIEIGPAMGSAMRGPKAPGQQGPI